VAVVMALLAVFFVIRHLVTPSIKLSRVRTAVVEMGPVNSTVDASGVVVPVFEEVLSCPFDTRVLKIHKEPGARLSPGDTILTLNARPLHLEADELRDRIALQQNLIEQNEISLILHQEDLKSDIAQLKLQIEYKEAVTKQQQTLFEMKAATEWDVRQAELDETMSRISLQKLEKQLIRQAESITKQIEGLHIEIELLRQQLVEKEELITQASPSLNRSSVLTWLIPEEGMALRKGEVMARVANLSSFKIEATASEIHSKIITRGMSVIATLGHDTLHGYVSNVPPSLNRGMVNFSIELDEPAHPVLKPNLRADIYVVINSKNNVLRIKKGPFANGTGRQEVFVIDGKTATRKDIVLGMAGVDYYEILEGVDVGETLVISNMRERLHLETIRVKK